MRRKYEKDKNIKRVSISGCKMDFDKINNYILRENELPKYKLKIFSLRLSHSQLAFLDKAGNRMRSKKLKKIIDQFLQVIDNNFEFLSLSSFCRTAITYQMIKEKIAKKELINFKINQLVENFELS
ncbi:MAG: hypothetical protein ACOC44_12375 [Promethearchaeia archaeon]